MTYEKAKELDEGIKQTMKRELGMILNKYNVFLRPTGMKSNSSLHYQMWNDEQYLEMTCTYDQLNLILKDDHLNLSVKQNTTGIKDYYEENIKCPNNLIGELEGKVKGHLIIRNEQENSKDNY